MAQELRDIKESQKQQKRRRRSSDSSAMQIPIFGPASVPLQMPNVNGNQSVPVSQPLQMLNVIGNQSAPVSQPMQMFAAQPARSQMPHSAPAQQRISRTDCKVLDAKLAKFVILGNHEFDVVEEPAFVSFAKGLCPGYDPPSRKVIGGRLLDDLYEEVKLEVEQVRVHFCIAK